MTTTQNQAGHYELRHNGHTYFIHRYRSDYGDIQWMVDRDDHPCWAQCDTLRQAKLTITTTSNRLTAFELAMIGPRAKEGEL